MTFDRTIVPLEEDEMACCLDPETDFGMQPGISPLVDNADLWAAAMNDPVAYYRSIDMGGRIWYFDHPMILTRSARRITGTGFYEGQVYDHPSDSIRFGTPTIIAYNGTSLSFNGTSVTASTADASATITLDGHDVSSEDVGIHLVITGGTNFIVDNHDDERPTGTWNGDTYVVLSVSVGNNTWTLDRACTTAAGSGMVGYATHILIRDASHGPNLSGLYTTGRTLANFTGGKYYSPGGSGGPRAFAGLRIESDYNGGLGDSVSTGKGRYEHMTFSNFEVGVMLGRDGRGAHDDLTSFTGQTDAHADYVKFDHCWFRENRTGIMCRCDQAVSLEFHRIKFDADHETCFHFERGGFVIADGVEIGGVGGWTLVKIGHFSSASSGYYRFNNVRTDAQPMTQPVKFLTTVDSAINQPNTLHQIIFDGGQIASGNGAYQDVDGFTGLFDVVGGQNVTVANWKNFRDKVFRMRGSTYSSSRKPHGTLRDCLFTQDITQLTDLIDWTNSSDGDYGWHVDVINCVDNEGNRYNGTITEADAP